MNVTAAVRALLRLHNPNDPIVRVEAVSRSGQKTLFEVDPDEASPLLTEAEARHSENFRWVYWFGTEYRFSNTQARCVKALWEGLLKGFPAKEGKEILLEAGSARTRLDQVFYDKGRHPAWGKMIVKCGKGLYRLNPLRQLEIKNE